MKTATLWGLFAIAAMGLLVNQSFAQGQGNCLGGDCPEGSTFVKFDVYDTDTDGDGIQDLVQTEGLSVDCEFTILETKEGDGYDEILSLEVTCDGYTFEVIAAKTNECDDEAYIEDNTGYWTTPVAYNPQGRLVRRGLSHIEFCLLPCPPEDTTVDIGDPYTDDTLKKLDVLFTNTNGFTGFNFYLLEGTTVAGCSVGGNPVDCGDVPDLPQEVTVTFMQTSGATSARFMGIAGTLCGDTDIDPALSFETPDSYQLLGNYPNPFNPSTTIRYQVPDASNVTLQVFDTLGRLVNTLYTGGVEAGTHSVEWDGTNSQGLAVSSGVYLYRLDAGTFTSTRSMLLFK